MLEALPSLFPNLLGTASGARAEFYDKFQREADEYDHDFMKKYDEDLNTTLIFVSPFFRIHPARGVNLGFLGTVRFVLRSHIRFHYRCPEKARAGFPRNELRAPQDCRQCLAWEHPN